MDGSVALPLQESKSPTQSDRQLSLIHISIRDLNNRVTVADVVATTGLSLNEVTEELNSVASQSQATLEVTNVGEVFYYFPQNFAYAYYAQGFKKVLLNLLNTVFKAIFFLFRISFGVILLLSFLFIFGTILLFQTVIGRCV